MKNLKKNSMLGYWICGALIPGAVFVLYFLAYRYKMRYAMELSKKINKIATACLLINALGFFSVSLFASAGIGALIIALVIEIIAYIWAYKKIDVG